MWNKGARQSTHNPSSILFVYSEIIIYNNIQPQRLLADLLHYTKNITETRPAHFQRSNTQFQDPAFSGASIAPISQVRTYAVLLLHENKQDAETASNGNTLIPNYMKIDQLIRKFKGNLTGTYVISLFLSLRE
jgi:hypothetical protein